jgi:hypothetical protein
MAVAGILWSKSLLCRIRAASCYDNFTSAAGRGISGEHVRSPTIHHAGCKLAGNAT